MKQVELTKFWFQEAHCYLNILLREERNLSEKQVEMLTWEAIIESVDTVSVTWEWLVYELAKNPKWQVMNQIEIGIYTNIIEH